jgi:glycosyltransferase involved in cell wall biosynthesis
MVTHGLARFYHDRRCVIFVADGGSTDDTREAAKEFQIKPWQEKVVSIYRGPAGKGTALRSVFEAAEKLQVRACAVVDADLRSITSDWVFYLLDPILEKGYEFVAPIYRRHKNDATITNNIVYTLTRALYGRRIRQPIGGDFAFSLSAAKFFAEQDVWETDVARYGIDIWMTTTAITQAFKLCQSHLGVKIHDPKDPARHLGAMFRQVVWVLFSLMEKFEDKWKAVKGSQPVETFNHRNSGEPEAIVINPEDLIQNFKIGFRQFSALWRDLFSPESYGRIQAAAEGEDSAFVLPIEAWVRILYELAATFHAWSKNRFTIIETAAPLYYARVASFVRQTREMSSEESESLVEEQALEFEQEKDYLVKIWDEKSS